ncbi:MAG TPA: hypothetical protein VNA19_05050 [Pyrinomonadaceae bacterium]|jgi:predicted  nucleic acid-binding Zn-ribbon protein|nr:hypothetical protein [Pyrinomonadaceae bacterium]
MLDEEMRKTMQFILEQQAQTAVQIDALTHAQRSAEERWTRTEASIRALLAVAEIHEREINTLGERQARLAEAQAEAQDRTDRQMAETDERLNALINTVERIMSKGRNGE